MNREELLVEYQRIPTGTVSDAMDKLNIPSGIIAGGPKAINLDLSSVHMAGYACTIQQMPKRQTNPGKTQQLEVYDRIAQPGEVVVIDAGGRLDTATTGGLQVLRATVRGLAGIVINGCCRDADEIMQGSLPVFCVGCIPRKSVLLETTGVNVPVTICNVQIRAGDLIVGDASGIVVVPAEAAEEVLGCAKKIKQVETEMERRLLAGEDYVGLRKRVEAELGL